MNLSATMPLGTSAGIPPAQMSRGGSIDSVAEGASSFREVMRGASAAQTGAAPQAADDVRQAASELLATAFIVPVLTAFREQHAPAGPFAPGTAERRFGPLLDEKIADHITQAANFPLIDAIVERVMARASLKEAPP